MLKCYIFVGVTIALYIWEYIKIHKILEDNNKIHLIGIYYCLKAVELILILKLNSAFFVMIKTVIACSYLKVMAVIDYKDRILPNQYIVQLIVLRGGVFILERIQTKIVISEFLKGYIIPTVIVIVFGMAVRVYSDKGIGMGDIKIFSILGSYFGSRVYEIIFISLFTSIISYIIFRYLGVKNKKMPLGPYIFLGLVLRQFF